MLVFADPGRYKHFPSILLVAVVAACVVDLLLLQPVAYPKYYLRKGCLAPVQHLCYELTAAAFAAPGDV